MEDLFMLWIQGGAWSVLLLSFSALKLYSFIFPFLFHLSNCESGLGPLLHRGVGKLLFCRRFGSPCALLGFNLLWILVVAAPGVRFSVQHL